MCGALIVYQSELDGRSHELGTSGFLYRANKLMYDHDTKSLWSTLRGEPVVGPLVGHGIKLVRRHVVTTTWGEWRHRHPDTMVLSLDTGHVRDYGEGVAYRDYFATDALKYNVPSTDRRLRNKQEVIALRRGGDQLAISCEFLVRNPVFHEKVGDQQFVILTDSTGASRVYESARGEFKNWDGKQAAIDIDGNAWSVSEEKLSGADGRELQRLPAHRAFWFGWNAQFPNTRLIK